MHLKHSLKGSSSLRQISCLMVLSTPKFIWFEHKGVMVERGVTPCAMAVLQGDHSLRPSRVQLIHQFVLPLLYRHMFSRHLHAFDLF